MSAAASGVAVVAFAHSPHVPQSSATTNGVEMLVPCFESVYRQLGIDRTAIDFWCSGSSDYLAGRAFSFISAIDAVGAVPPINESHVEMDSAWALYEAYVKILTGEVDVALAYGFGKASASDIDRTLALQTDPYTVAPLWPTATSLAALQARIGLDSGAWTREQMDAVTGIDSQGAPLVADPLVAQDICQYTDGAAVVVIASAERAASLTDRPAWITGWDHRIDTPNFGARDLTRSESTELAAAAAMGDNRSVNVAELHAAYSHQQILLKNSLGLDDSVAINPSGGALAANPLFAAGLERIGYAATAILGGNANTAVAHATNGPLLQQNMVVAMEARD